VGGTTVTIRSISRPKTKISSQGAIRFLLSTVVEFLVRLSVVLVNQVVSWDYIKVQRNFVRVMEANSKFTRDNLYVVCLDEQSASYLELEMGIRCFPLGPMHEFTRSFVWKLRVEVLSCLVQEGG